MANKAREFIRRTRYWRWQNVDGKIVSLMRSMHNNKKVTFAESCTGGLISSLITKESGSSAVFEAGFITYSNAMKTKMIDVPESLLIEHGAVSEPVVKAMLTGALKQSGADVGVAVSGIAGPNGGTNDKPVGLVWIAWGDAQVQHTVALLLTIPRTAFQQYVATAAIDLVKRHVLDIVEPPEYLSTRAFKK